MDFGGCFDRVYSFCMYGPCRWSRLRGANLVAALVHRWPFHPAKWKKGYWLAFLSFLFIPATTVVGVVGWIEPGMVPRPKASAVLVWVDNGLFIAFILLIYNIGFYAAEILHLKEK